MFETLPTVTIDTPNGPVRINATEYDPAVHKLAKGSEPPPPPAAPVEPAAPAGGMLNPVDAPATTADNTPAAGEPATSDDNAPPPPPPGATEPPAPPAAPSVTTPPPPPPVVTMTVPAGASVTKVGKRYFITDKSGAKIAGQPEKGYDTAEAAAGALNGK